MIAPPIPLMTLVNNRHHKLTETLEILTYKTEFQTSTQISKPPLLTLRKHPKMELLAMAKQIGVNKHSRKSPKQIMNVSNINEIPRGDYAKPLSQSESKLDDTHPNQINNAMWYTKPERRAYADFYR